LALAGIVILLVGQFNSFRKGGIILATIPLILIGGTLGLIVMGQLTVSWSCWASSALPAF